MNDPMPQDTKLEAVRAKMTCHAHDTSRWGSLPGQTTHKVRFGVVCGDNGEDKTFSDATPSGECWLNISGGRPALNFFEPGKRYYVTFTEASN